MEGHDSLRKVIDSTPIIDHHAHPLLKLSAIEKHPFLAVATEAHGDAINDSRTGLPHFRAVNGLARILGCEATWEAVVEAVREKRAGDYEAWVARCLSGIETVLADDGLDNTDDAESYEYFSGFTPSPSKRIVRIEHVAVRILNEHVRKHADAQAAFDQVLNEFLASVRHSLADPEVVGFKSVICYRTGLAIPGAIDREKAFQVFQQHHGSLEFSRVNHSGLNELFVHLVAEEIEKNRQSFQKPIQFHTGLGDNDLTLNKSSPAHLQEFIRKYPTVPIVLLHSGYPFTRETGYLAAMYANVYADIGEVFPFLSRDGQEGVVRQILELCPGSKITWSTDGHWFPETYLLAVEQMKEVLHTVLTGYVEKGDLNLPQATQLVQDIFFNNSNRLYNLKLSMSRVKSPMDKTDTVTRDDNGEKAIEAFLKRHGDVRYLRVYFLDLTATPRTRAVPLPHLRSVLKSGQKFKLSIPSVALGMIQIDVPVPGAKSVGAYELSPDLDTLSPGPRQGHCMTLGTITHMDGSPVPLCPRTLLKRTLDEAARRGLSFILGFEIELVILRRAEDGRYEPLAVDGQAWSVARPMEHPIVATVLEEAIDKLAESGIYVEALHPESANGQYEVVLPKAPALQAVSNLIYAREVISALCTAKGYKMTLYPKPIVKAAGTASHVHLSISSEGGSERHVYEPFYAGVLRHLRALVAFTYSNIASYDRVEDGCWAGGTWVAWGTQNRETPLRKIKDGHWELKFLDGLANPYLAMSAILQAGMSGIANQDKLLLGDCLDDPASLTDAQRQELGVTTRIPGTLAEALDALEADDELCKLLGAELVERYVSTKKAETELLEGLGEEERRRWIMERY